jgi:hypothetical protein
MGLKEDIDALRQYLDDLAGNSDDDLARYQLLRPSKPPGHYWQIRWFAGRILRWLESARLKQSDPWPVGLKHHGSARAKPLLIWAIGTDRETQRTACRRLTDLRVDRIGFSPVLVTDVADFAFFSRLGWLVEYLPIMEGQGQPYEERKARFLARLYRGAPALPVGAISKADRHADEIRRWLNA